MADFIYIESTGTVLPDTSDTIDTVEAEFRDALGQQLVVDPATPQGRLISTEVSARDNMLRNNAALANQINPDLAGGVFLDAIWKLTGGQRLPATQSVALAVTLAGTPATFVPEGSQARTGAGAIFQTLADATIGVGGTVSVDMASIDFGPIPAAVGAISTVVSAVLGWETVTNPTAAVVGQLVESDVASRNRRRVTLALQGVALPEAIISALYDTTGVRSLVFRENTADTAQVIDGVNLIAHSIYAVVDGGSDTTVATALLANKSLGASYNGATTVNVVEPVSGQTYAVKFDRPTLVPVKVRATVKVQGALADVATAVRAAIIAYALRQLPNETGLIVGQSVSPFELAGAVNEVIPQVYVKLMEVALIANAFGTVEVPITIQQLATINVNDIQVLFA
jgi:hypothetical protein